MAEPPVESKHETRDFSFRTIALFAASLILVLAIVSIGLLVLFSALATGQAKSDVLPSMVTPQLPPKPRLEVEPGGDLQVLRATEDKQLSTYGWVDRKRGTVHIPIDQAMQLLAKQGLPLSSQKPQRLEF
jgi:hypothetical protein